MGRLLAVMPVRNEAERYLDSAVSWLEAFTDGIAVYDNMSHDDSVEIAEKRGAVVKVRPVDRPGFLDHEGAFRQDAWTWMEESLQPEQGDWIFAVDADEFLVGPSGFPGHDLKTTLEGIDNNVVQMNVAIMLSIPEVFDVQSGQPMIRIDGAWGSINSPRIFRWLPGAAFADKALASGSEPLYVNAALKTTSTLTLMHFGYAVAEDRDTKYRLWSSMATPGHSSAHVESILKEPLLVPWTGARPEVWRGRR